MPTAIRASIAAAVLAVVPLAAQQSSSPPSQQLRLAKLFADGMVIQRDQPVVVWGWSAPSAAVRVDLHGRTVRVKASAAGTWKASLPAEQAGGPFALSVSTASDRIDVRDVYVGDVWVASGQSNMEFMVAQGNNAAAEIAGAHDPMLRQFKVPDSWADDTEPDLAGGSWSPADPEHVGQFSAVGYFFARALRATTGVPIGLINTTWGGSAIEAWLSRSASHLSADQWKAVLQQNAAAQKAVRDSLSAALGGLPTVDSGLVDGRARWADTALDDTEWRSIRVPGYWEGQGYPGMDGVAWYRIVFDISNEELRTGAGARIVLDAVDDDDITWINGVEVGRTAGYNKQRSYEIPASALHAGRNILTVRVTDGGGGGGINGPAALVLADGARRSLAGTWKFKVGAVSFQPDGQQINKIPTVLYNKMVYPLLPFPIKGVIWYQGESNANNVQQAAAYRGQFEALIESWRREWNGGRGAFPFLWVQLPNYGQRPDSPPLDDAWATQRESMDAALALPHTGRAITIDVGDPDNIHPTDKQDVGARLARVARATVYGERVSYQGPSYRSHTIRGDTVYVDFANAAGLVAKPGGEVRGFELAGADHRFVWAAARISGSRVAVWSDRVHAPIAVRYAWASNPPATLYNGDGLPAVPFRSDRW